MTRGTYSITSTISATIDALGFIPAEPLSADFPTRQRNAVSLVGIQLQVNRQFITEEEYWRLYMLEIQAVAHQPQYPIYVPYAPLPLVLSNTSTAASELPLYRCSPAPVAPMNNSSI
jgi:hypothetical protein